MRGLLSDADVDGCLVRITELLNSPDYELFWQPLRLTTHHLRDFGMGIKTPDRMVWHLAQSEQLVLITGNRNHDGPDSLEATIRDSNELTCLPVMTIGDPPRIMRDSHYARRAVDRLLDFVMAIDRHLGAGRLYIP